ncbi:MAG: DEAD/DEAH box helicase [Haloarculaceae archaeon]
MAATDAEGETFVDRPLVTPGLLERREYQLELAEAASAEHTLVCLPTGLGKTAVSLLVTAHRLHEYGGTSLLLAPTKPLVEQHAAFYREGLTIPDEEVVVFTGEVRPDDRAALWDDARVVVATPQVVENDLIGNRISLADVTHLTFDECHRATGDYAYNYIAERYHADADRPLVTGMSASPGGDKEAILRVCRNLGLREVEVMTEADADVDEHTYETTVDWQQIDLPEEVLEVRDELQAVVKSRLEKLRELGLTRKSDPGLSEGEIRKMQAKARELMNNDDSSGYEAMSLLAELRKIRTAVTYVETQSVESLRRYFERQREAARSSGASKASQRFVSEPKVKEAMRRAEAYDDIHPKFRRARILLAETLGIEGGDRVILFTESRDTAETLTEFLGNHFDVEKFVGQSDTEGSEGMTQTEQRDTLDRFRDGEFEVLVSTSVAEEGLDVPEVDLVLFYEPVPKGIRSIQRKGRTGRQREGRVVVLIANDTRDEAYYWMSRNEEKKMEEELRKLKGAAGDIEAELDAGEQAGLETFSAADASRGVDHEPEPAPDPTNPTDETTGTADAGGSEAAERAAAEPTDTDATTGGNGPGEPASTGASNGGQSGLAAFAGNGSTDVDAGAGEAGPDVADATDSVDEDTDSEEDGGVTVVATAGRDAAVEVVIDQRELDSHIARDLSQREGVTTRLETLEVGDYVLSDRVVVERKSVGDFLDTLTGGDRSMFEQVGAAARHYARPVVVVEGEDLYGRRNVHPNAIRGALASLAVDFGASVLRTSDTDDTAELLYAIARREQEDDDRSVSVHGEKGSKTLAEQQEYVVGAIAEVGPVTARSLLAHFGSVEATMTADREALLEVSGVGEVTADRIREVVGSAYADQDADGGELGADEDEDGDA